MAADGSIVIEVNTDIGPVDKQLAALKKKIASLEKSISSTESKRNPLAEQMQQYGAELDTAKAKLEALKAEQSQIQSVMSLSNTSVNPEQYIDAYSRKPQVDADVTAQLSQVDALQRKFDSVARRVEAYDAKLKTANSNLSAMQEQAGGLELSASREAAAAEQVATATAKASTSAERMSSAMAQSSGSAASMSAAAQQANSSMQRLGKRIAGLAGSALVFSVITKALTELRSWLLKVIQTNDEARAAMARLKGSLLTLAQPIVNVVIPAFVTLVNVMAKVINTISALISSIFGTTITQSGQAAEGLYNETEALEGTADALNDTGKAAKKAVKSLASFDEINQLADNSSSDSGSSGGGSGGSVGGSTGSIAPDFTGLVSNQLSAIAELFTGTALLALGAILTFSGTNIPLGIALMIAGALLVWDAVSTNWDAIQAVLQGPLGDIVTMVSVASLAIGAILTFSGANIPLGIGLMIAGLVGVATMAAVNWDAIQVALQGPIGTLTSILGGAMLVLGAILTFSGANIPLGIGVMITGALLFGTVAAVNWNTIQPLLEGPIGILTAVLSGAALVIGAILTFSGANLPLGIGLMAAGAIALAAVVAANWNTIQDLLEGPLGIIAGIVGAATLVVGAILTFTGANIPIGIALLASGAAALISAIKANWNTMKQKLSGSIGLVVGVVSAALLALGAILLFTGAGIPLGLGLIAVGAIGIASSIAANWNQLSSTLGGKINTITSLASAAALALGVILLFTGAGIPLGLGLIAAGAAGLITSISPNWDSIRDALSSAWQGVKNFWNSHISKYFTADWWANLGKNAINGLIRKVESGINSLISGAASWANKLIGILNHIPGVSLGYVSFSRISLPRLAQGAVIPPNKEFLAVLGDQKSGTNIETPLSTMVQAFKQAMADGNATGDIYIYLDSDQIAYRVERHQRQSSIRSNGMGW